MKVIINGKSQELSGTRSVADIVGEFGANRKPILTEVNGLIVPHNAWGGTPVKEGDSIELVSFVGGG